MGVEVVKNGGFEVAPAPFEGKPEVNGKLDQGKGDKVSIKFGSHGEQQQQQQQQPQKKAEENVLISDVPKDAAEEWPAAKQIHTFYFVKHRSYDDPKIKAKIELADKEFEKLNKARGVVLDELRAKRAERSKLFELLDPLKSERNGFNTKFDEKRKEMEPLQQALGKLKSNDGGSARGPAICSSEQELNNMIYSFQYRIQHESISLNEEKQIMKEIKLLEGTREKVIANAAVRAKIKEAMGPQEDIQGQVKLMGAGLDGVKKERQAISARINQLSEKLKATKDEIQVLENELKVVTDKKDKVSSNIRELRKQRDEMNAGFYQGRNVLNKARDLAAQKNITELEALCNAEVEKFVSLWCSKKNFREDYEKRILRSLDTRQLSRDGRMRNPEEKPLIAPEVPPSKPTPSETEVVVPKAKAKPQQPKEEPKADTTQKTEKAKEVAKVKEAVVEDDEEEVYGLGKTKKEEEKPVDEATLKAMRKEEEIAKAKQAMERKKKQAEKNAAKAALRAQKEAEKKEKKDQEKKAKKSGGNTEAEAVSEEVPEASEVEKEIEAPVQQVEKPQKKNLSKEKQIRSRIRSRGSEALPRAILKRKKATNYWIWAAPAALVVLILLVLGYYYVL